MLKNNTKGNILEAKELETVKIETMQVKKKIINFEQKES